MSLENMNRHVPKISIFPVFIGAYFIDCVRGVYTVLYHLSNIIGIHPAGHFTYFYLFPDANDGKKSFEINYFFSK